MEEKNNVVTTPKETKKGIISFNVTIEQVTKYNPSVHTITVDTKDELTARSIVLDKYGRKKIKIVEVKEVESKDE